MFPSLGATAFLFFETPMAEVASPRNTIIGHFVGAAIAYGWLVVFGLTDAPSALESGFTLGRAAAVALSVGCTGGVLRLLRAAHPPAGATTVIVSAGLLTSGEELLVLAAGVALLTLSAGASEPRARGARAVLGGVLANVNGGWVGVGFEPPWHGSCAQTVVYMEVCARRSGAAGCAEVTTVVKFCTRLAT